MRAVETAPHMILTVFGMFVFVRALKGTNLTTMFRFPSIVLCHALLPLNQFYCIVLEIKFMNIRFKDVFSWRNVIGMNCATSVTHTFKFSLCWYLLTNHPTYIPFYLPACFPISLRKHHTRAYQGKVNWAQTFSTPSLPSIF